MSNKSLERMTKSNKISLSAERIEKGLNRFGWLIKSKFEHAVSETALEDGRFHCRVSIWNKSKYKLIARIGISKNEARAKIGLALPLKSIINK